MYTNLENYCEMCQTLAVVCPDISHPKTHLKQAETSFHEDIILEERCDICEARGCKAENHDGPLQSLKAAWALKNIWNDGPASKRSNKCPSLSDYDNRPDTHGPTLRFGVREDFVGPTTRDFLYRAQ